MIRLFIVAEVRFYRDGLAEIISKHPNCSVVGTASIRSEVGERVRELVPDIVLLDTGTPDGLAIVRDITTWVPTAKVVAIALVETEHAVLEWAEVGVVGYVPRDASLADLIAAIERTARGELQCSTRVAAGMLRRLATLAKLASGRDPGAASARLTPREREIMGLIAQGLSNKEIARKLGIGVATTKSHVHHILGKLQVHRRAQAAARVGQGAAFHAG